jgi:hypothetical protein
MAEQSPPAGQLHHAQSDRRDQDIRPAKLAQFNFVGRIHILPQ